MLILPANSLTGGYEIANSLRFNSGSSDNLTRTFGSGNRRTFTISCWLKRSNLGADGILNTYTNGSNYWVLEFNSSDQLVIKNITGGSTNVNLITNAVFRDISAWYNFVVETDTTQSTSSDRVKLYVSGSQITSFGTETYPSQNADLQLNQAQSHMIGAGVASGYFNGYLAEFVFIDGQALDPTSFGEFDEDSNIWKPIKYTGTFGTNGFYLDFENSGSLGADASGNGNNFTVNNLTSIDQVTDTPTNNFATWNSISTTGGTFSNGNLTHSGTDISNSVVGNLGVTTGKWYWEIKIVSSSAPRIGVFDLTSSTPTQLSNDAYGWCILTSGGNSYVRYNGVGTLYTGASMSNGNIIMIAYDADAGKLWYGENGSWLQSGDPANGTNPSQTSVTGIITASAAAGAAGTHSFEVNFGNPPFTISSGNSDGRGYGNFEYAVPTGYYALNNKNLAEFG